MDTKLILTVDKSTIKVADRFAKLNGQSLSAMIETYLKSLVKNRDTILNLIYINHKNRKRNLNIVEPRSFLDLDCD